MHAHIGTGSFQAITRCQNVLYGVVYYLCCHSFMSDSLQPHRLEPARLLCPGDFPGKNTGVGCRFLLQGIFPTQGRNPGLLHWQADSLPLSHQGETLLAVLKIIGKEEEEGCRLRKMLAI